MNLYVGLAELGRMRLIGNQVRGIRSFRGSNPLPHALFNTIYLDKNAITGGVK